MKNLFVLLCAWLAIAAGAKGVTTYEGVLSNGLDVVLIEGHEHSQIRVRPTDMFAGTQSLQFSGAGSSENWISTAVETDMGRTMLVLSFATAGLTNAATSATITVSNFRNDIRSFEVRAIRRTLNVVKLIDDPLRGVAYGIHQIGTEPGALVRFDIGTTNITGIQSLGARPTDLDLSEDGVLVAAISSAAGTLTLVQLTDLAVIRTATLPGFENWDANVTTADVAWGAGRIIYYTDAKWDPTLRVYDWGTGQLLQTVSNIGSDTGIGDVAVLPNKSMLFAWRQFGWSAGSLTSWVARYQILSDGTLAYLSQSLPESSFAMERDPLNTPILPTHDSSSVFVKGTLWSTNSLTRETRRFPQPIYSISAGGEVAFSRSRIYDGETGLLLGDLPVETDVQSLASSQMKLVYFDPLDRQLKVFGFRHLVDPDLALGSERPAGSSTVNRPVTLGWDPLPATQEYHVYFGKDPAQFSGTNSYLGKTSFPFVRLNLDHGEGVGDFYYWRAVGVHSLDSMFGGSTGDVPFWVADITLSLPRVSEHALEGQIVSGQMQLAVKPPGTLSWELTPEAPWISLSETQGAGPRMLSYTLDSTIAGPGVHSSSIAVRSGGQLLYRLPVELRAVRRNIVMIEPDRGGANFFAVNIDHSILTNEAFLVSINGDTEQIERVVPVGRGVTDLAVHPVDDKIYVANSLEGQLTILDKSTLSNVHTISFAPYGGVGSEEDVFAVAAGATGRIMLEEQDQWVDMTFYDTVLKTNVAVTGVREGGGAFGGLGRFYFHGDNNSSGAHVRRFDTYGDQLAEVASRRVDFVDYYGSRVVTVSDFGNRVFWNGGVFDGDLNLEQTLGAEVYATSADGRYAFGEAGLIDLDTSQFLLSNLVPSFARAFNRQVSKFAYSDGTNLFFLQITNLAREWPTLTGLTTNASSILVAWSDLNGETGYSLERSETNAANFQVLASLPANVTQFADSDLIANATYHYRIKGHDSHSNSIYSPVLTIDSPISGPLLPPVAPVQLSLAPGTNQIVVNWIDVGSEAGYRLERSLGNSNGWQLLTSLAADSIQYVDAGLIAATNYYYRLVATNSAGASDYSNVRFAQLVASPDIPVFTSISASVNQVWLSWPTVAHADGVILQRASSESGPWIDLSELEPATTQAADQTVSAGASYFYRLVATNYLGISSISSEQSVSVPTVPEGVSGLSTNGLLAYWSFDQPVGSKVVSEEYGGFNGVLSESGASIETNGIHGNALILSRSLDGIMDAGDVLDLTNMNFTISCWFRTPVGESRDNTILIHKHMPGHRNGYFMGLNTTAFRLVSNKGYFYVGDVNQPVSSPISTNDTLVSSTDVNDGSWHQLTVVHGHGTAKRLYVDGVLEDLLPFEGFTANSNHFVLGGHGDGVFSGAFEGQIDEVRVYDRLLSSVEVAASYHRFVPAPPLVAPLLSPPVIDFNAVVLSWSDVAGETNYVVERRLGELGSWSVLTNIFANGTNAWDFDIQSGRTYWYRVIAEGYGESSPASVEQSIAISSASAPSAPALGMVVLSADSIALSWNDVAGENYYVLERRLGASNPWSVATTVTAGITNHVDADLLPNQTYMYRIKAVNFAGPSPYSEIVTGVTPSGAPKPTLLTVDVINGDVPLLNWTDVTNETAYRVERTLDPGLSGWIVLTNQSNNALYDWQRIRGATNHYRVIAVNALGESPPSNVEQAFIIDPFVVDRPVLYSPMPTTNMIGLSWSVITNAANYVLERSIASSTNWSVIAVIPYGSTNFADTNVVAAVDYFYRVKAANAQRESEYSQPVNAGVYVPNPPVAPLLTIDLVSKTGVGLFWSNPTNETRFELERSLAESNLWTRIHTAAANVTNHTDTNVVAGSLYDYRVRAGNAEGDSPYSDIAAVHVPDPQAPSAPSNLVARPLYPALVKLSWGDLTNETAFRLERRIDAGVWGQLTQLGADELSFVDTNVVVGTRYHYRVIASNSLGDSPPLNDDSIVPFAEAEVLADDFDDGLKPGLWTSVSGGVVTNGSGFNGSPALYFNGAVERSAITSPLDVSTGGNIVFQFRGGDQGVEPWELPEPGRWVVVEYTVDDGNTWIPINGQAPLGHLAWTEVVLPIPAAAFGSGTCFRWRQLAHTGTADNWAIDGVSIRGSLPPVPAQVSFLLTHTQSGREIVLAWVKAARATYFRVERATATESWMSVATVSASRLTVTDADLRPGTIYYYRIVAVNAAGAAPASNAAQAETWPSLDHWNHENYGNRNAGDFTSMGNLLPDGSRPILRYAFRLSAQETRRIMDANGDSGYPRMIFDRTRDRLCVQFVRRKPVTQPGITYRVEFSDDFRNWSAGGTLTTSRPIDAVWEKVEFEDSVSGAGRAHRYIRVVVEILP